MGNSALSIGGAMNKDPILNTVRLKELLDDPPEPPEGQVILYMRTIDGKPTYLVRKNSGGGEPDIVEITRGT